MTEEYLYGPKKGTSVVVFSLSIRAVNKLGVCWMSCVSLWAECTYRSSALAASTGLGGGVGVSDSGVAGVPGSTLWRRGLPVG